MERKQDDTRPLPASFEGEASGGSPVKAKRSRLVSNADADKANKTPQCQRYTILDVLNPDCWRLVLDYVSVRDVVRSERVSRGWQRVVRDYLAGAHRLVHLYNDDNFFERRTIYEDCHVIELEKHDFFKEVVAKWGPFIVAVTARLDQAKLEAVVQHCPDLKSLTVKVDDEIQNFTCIRNCTNLKRIVIHSKQLEDGVLLGAVINDHLEEVAVIGPQSMTGLFLISLKSHLKTLIIEDGRWVKSRFLISVADRLTGLRRLELNSLTEELIHEIHSLLYHTPHLEYLSLMHYFDFEVVNLGPLERAVCRLKNLKELYLCRVTSVTQTWLVAVAQSCSALRVLDISFCLSVRGNGVAATCRARPQLTKLSICRISVTDEDVENAVRCCKDLEFLDISWCYRLTKSITSLISWLRERPLHVRVFGSRAEKKGKYEGIQILRERPPHIKTRY